MTRIAIVLAVMASAATSFAQPSQYDNDPKLDPDYDARRKAGTTAVVVQPQPPLTLATSPLGGMPQNAFVFEARLSLGGTLAASGATGVDANGNVVDFAPSGVIAQPSFFLGARLADRYQVGLGMSFVRFGAKDFSTNNFLFMPTVAVDLIKSRDNTTAFYIKPGLGLGASVATAGGRHDTSAIVALDVALGARKTLGSMFALGFESGVSASWTNPSERTQTDVVFIYGAIVGTFYAGR